MQDPQSCLTCDSKSVLATSPGPSSCVACFHDQDFKKNVQICSKGPKSFVNWTVTLGYSSRFNNKQYFDLTIAPNTSLLDSSLQNILVVPATASKVSSVFRISFSNSYLSVVYTDPSLNVIGIYSNKKLQAGEGFTVDIGTYDDVASSTVVSSQTTSVVLIYQTLEVASPVTPSSAQQLPEALQKISQTTTMVSRATTSSMAGAVLISSMCSVNIGPAFIKLFQIIEILGKFYYVPIDFSALMDYFMQSIYSVSDIINTSPTILIPYQLQQPNRWRNKLSINKESEYLLQSNPVFTLLFVFLKFVVLILELFSNLNQKPNKLFGKVRSFLGVLTSFIFEIAYVDFLFQGSMTLLSRWRDAVYDGLYILNKFLGMFLMVECILYTLRNMEACLYETNRSKEAGLVDSPEKILKRRDPKEASLHKVKDEHLKEILEELKPEQQNNLHARLLTALYYIKIVAYQLLLVSGQNNPGFTVINLLLVTSSSFIYFVYVVVKYNPYRNVVILVQKISFEVCLLIFVGSISIRKIGLYTSYIDYAVMLMTLNGILTQLVSTMKYMFDSLKQYFQKRAALAHISVAKPPVLGPKTRSIEYVAPKPLKVNIGSKIISSRASMFQPSPNKLTGQFIKMPKQPSPTGNSKGPFTKIEESMLSSKTASQNTIHLKMVPLNIKCLSNTLTKEQISITQEQPALANKKTNPKIEL